MVREALMGRRRWLACAAGFAAGSAVVGRLSANQGATPARIQPASIIFRLLFRMPQKAAAFYGRIFDPQVFHERTGVQRFYVRLGSAYIAFGPRADAMPYIDHIAVGVVDFVEADFGNAETKAQLTAAGLTAPPGALPMLSDPDNLRLQLVNATHGLFDTLMPGGRVTTEPAAFTPIGLDHIMVSVTDVEKSAAYYRKAVRS